jgi:multidrug efflux pump subunit AcrA (membrane-fusion protein)
MKTLILILATAALAACSKPTAEHHAQPPENGAQYKKDKGIALTDSMKKAIALKVAEVEEAKVAPSFTVALHVMADGGGIQRVSFSPTANAASGWLTSGQAAIVKPGMDVELVADTPGAPRERGVVKRVEKAPYQTLGDFEVSVESASPLPTGARVLATFRAPAGEAVTAIPRSALLTTAEGHFVYAVNADFYVRTPVKVGALSDDHAEITDGLYTGDEVVVSPVMSLWLAELQVLRGGKACTCGN